MFFLSYLNLTKISIFKNSETGKYYQNVFINLINQSRGKELLPCFVGWLHNEFVLVLRADFDVAVQVPLEESKGVVHLLEGLPVRRPVVLRREGLAGQAQLFD